MIDRTLTKHLAETDQLEAQTLEQIESLFLGGGAADGSAGHALGVAIREACAALEVRSDLGPMLAAFLAIGAARILERLNQDPDE
jgi:hypothetical protein